MGLDVYVGSLTRYYAGDWELIAQTFAREAGLPLEIVRPQGSTEPVRDPAVIRPAVLGWRSGLSEGLGKHIQAPLDWDESPEAPYFTDKPTWDCYADLILWAAYDEQRAPMRPVQHLEQWSDDPAYRACTAEGFRSIYSHLYDVALWLPCRFSIVFRAEDAGGADTMMGSSLTLCEQLHELNSRTWQAEPGTLAEWRHAGCDHGAPLESGARFAFSIFHELSSRSAEHHLPMRLDW